MEQSDNAQQSPNEQRLLRLLNVYSEKNATLQFDLELSKDDNLLAQEQIKQLRAELLALKSPKPPVQPDVSGNNDKDNHE